MRLTHSVRPLHRPRYDCVHSPDRLGPACHQEWLQITQDLCQLCLQQGRQVRQVHMRLSVATLNMEAPGVLDAPQLQACVLCDQRVRQLFQRIALHAPRVRWLHILPCPTPARVHSRAQRTHTSSSSSFAHQEMLRNCLLTPGMRGESPIALRAW